MHFRNFFKFIALFFAIIFHQTIKCNCYVIQTRSQHDNHQVFSDIFTKFIQTKQSKPVKTINELKKNWIKKKENDQNGLNICLLRTTVKKESIFF